MSKKFFTMLLMLAVVPLAAARQEPQAVPSGMNMVIRLETPLSTHSNHAGDSFTATVMEPDEFRDCRITGHVRDIHESGKLKGRTEMSLAFDSIELRKGQVRPLHAQVQTVFESETVKVVDDEGRIQSGSRGNQTLKRSGIGAAVGGALGG